MRDPMRHEPGQEPDQTDGGRSADDDRTGLPSDEDLEDALVEGDRTIARGTARAAWQHRTFRQIWIGSWLSNVGTWMQNVVLGAFAYQLTESESFVALVTFAQLGPLLLFTLIGGTLADMFDRRRLLLVVAVEQMALSCVLAYVVAQPDPSKAAILGVVLLIGVGQAVHAPTFTSVLPALVPREDLAGAVSLQSVNMNASRVIGPAIGGLVAGAFGASAAFLANAASYLFIVAVLLQVRFPPVVAPPGAEKGLRRVLAGFTVARHDRVIGRCLITMVLFSFLCLPFIAQMPSIAEQNLGVDADGVAYGLLYAAFGLGALLGALSIGTVLAGAPLATVVRLGLAGFALCLAAFSLLRDAAPAYPVALLLGFCYFATVTSLSTVLQTRLHDHERGRVMALWIMAFGGTVPIGALVFGPIMEATSITSVVLFGAAMALVLILVADLDGPDRLEPAAPSAPAPG